MIWPKIQYLKKNHWHKIDPPPYVVNFEHFFRC